MDFKLPKIKLDAEPNAREKVFFAGALIGVLFLFSSNIWSPVLENIGLANSELKSVNLQIEAVNKLIEVAKQQVLKDRSGSKSKEYQGFDKQAKLMLDRRVVDTSAEIQSTVELLTNRLLGGRLKVVKVEIGDRIDKTSYVIVPIMIDVTGPYSGLQKYLEALEGADRPLVVKQFELLANKDTPSVLNSNIELELYIVKR